MILVTGATGFLGTTLILQLTAKGNNVVALRRESAQIPQQLKENPLITWRIADINDVEDLADAFAGVRQVYHCAALVSFHKKDKNKLFKTNIEGTANVVNLCIENQARLLHVSSIAALGEPIKGQTQLNEKNFWEYNPKASNYALSKYNSEMEVWRGITEGLNAVIVNPTIIIGASAKFSGSGALFKYALQKPLFYTAGGSGFVTVDDVAECMIQLMESDHCAERYIISAENMSYRELFTQMATAFGIAAPRWPAQKWLIGMAWRIHKLSTWIGAGNIGLSQETARISTKQSFYSNEKIKQTLFFNFKPLKTSIAEICHALQQ